MKQAVSRSIVLVLVLAAVAARAAEFKFASVISDNAVLQRDVAAPVWGFGEPGKSVKLALNGTAVGEATVAEDGRWTVKLPVQKANKKPSTITATCAGETVSITNVLFGDVWFGCGQSNMAYTFAGYGRLPIGGEDFLKKAQGNPCIRTLLMNDGENKNAAYPREDAVGIRWETSTYDSMRKNGAALYWMGWKLNQALDVPIGLVNASWGATKIDGWLDQLWGREHGTGHGKGICNFWYNRWQDFLKKGGVAWYEKAIVEWSKRYDPGYLAERAKPSLHEAAFDDSSWKPVTPGEKGFQDDPFPKGYTGEVWLRATFVLSAADLKKNWAIGYNDSFGQDMTYLNGKAFGGSGNPNHGYGCPIREYGIAGTNVIAVRYKVWNGPDGKAGGMHKPLAITLWPSNADRRELALKACIGEQPPRETWKYPELRKPEDARAITMFSATSMDAGLVHPLYPMAITGAVWYQGCSDLGNGKYPELFKTLVEGWRAQFTHNGKLPVIITEICPHQLDTKPNSLQRIEKGETAVPTWSVNADMRRQLNELATFLPDCDTISLLDLGEADIHPIRKEEVGERYANWALQHVYGKPVEGSCPQIASVDWKGAKVVLHIKNAKGLKTRDGQSAKGFELAGPVTAGEEIDTKTGKPKEGVLYHYCDATIVGDTIELSCPQVTEAFSFRYAWFDLDLGWNVVNGAGLPLGTCRGFQDGQYHSQIIPGKK
jgi:sialate O-acetylesterase